MDIIKKTKKIILDILFPINCVGCGKDDTWFCDKCLIDFKTLSFQVCPQCEKTITASGQICNICKASKNNLDGIIVASDYKENNIAKLVHIFKYNFASDLHIPLGKILSRVILKNNLSLPDFIIPIPLHNRRLRFRGFNQSELIAKYLSKNLTPGFEIPVLSNIIIRKKYTQPQMKIEKYLDRQKNIQDAFVFNKNSQTKNPLQQIQNLNNCNILLIDDIATTGSTLIECAKILKQNGAKKVFGAVIARQSFK